MSLDVRCTFRRTFGPLTFLACSKPVYTCSFLSPFNILTAIITSYNLHIQWGTKMGHILKPSISMFAFRFACFQINSIYSDNISDAVAYLCNQLNSNQHFMQKDKQLEHRISPYRLVYSTLFFYFSTNRNICYSSLFGALATVYPVYFAQKEKKTTTCFPVFVSTRCRMFSQSQPLTIKHRASACIG